MSKNLLKIKELRAEVDGQPILKGVNLTIPRGEVHAIMGPNGSGKSTLANVLMGHPSYTVTSGTITFDGQDVTEMPADERARLGMFLAFQYPVEVPGVSVLNFLRSSMQAVTGETIKLRQFRKRVGDTLAELGMDLSFARRNLNEGFSGGEKKRNEVLQLRLLEPQLAILDETDSGLDIDAIRLVGEQVAAVRDERRSVMVITHYMRILDQLNPDCVHILFQGRVVQSGGPQLARELEQSGYDAIRRQFGQAEASPSAMA